MGFMGDGYFDNYSQQLRDFADLVRAAPGERADDLRDAYAKGTEIVKALAGQPIAGGHSNAAMYPDQQPLGNSGISLGVYSDPSDPLVSPYGTAYDQARQNNAAGLLPRVRNIGVDNQSICIALSFSPMNVNTADRVICFDLRPPEVQEPPPPVPQDEGWNGSIPFSGGQCPIIYRVNMKTRVMTSYQDGFGLGAPRVNLELFPDLTMYVLGPIRGVYLYGPNSPARGKWGMAVLAKGIFSQSQSDPFVWDKITEGYDHPQYANLDETISSDEVEFLSLTIEPWNQSQADNCGNRGPIPPQQPPEDEPVHQCDCDELLRLARATYKRTGGDNDFPVNVPTLLSNSSDATEAIQSIPQLVVWLAKQIDALAGEYPIKVKIKDTDPLRQGDQAEDIEFPNQAEFNAELFGVAYESSVQVQLMLGLLMRLVPEVIATKNSSLVNQDFTTTIAEYMGMRTKDKVIEVPCNFTPERADSISMLMKDSVMKLKGVKDVDPHTMVEWLQKISYYAQLAATPSFRGKDELDQLEGEIKAFAEDPSKGAQEKLDGFVDFVNSQFSTINRGVADPRPKAVVIPNVRDDSAVIPGT